jgi:hypothetical protein
MDLFLPVFEFGLSGAAMMLMLRLDLVWFMPNRMWILATSIRGSGCRVWCGATSPHGNEPTSREGSKLRKDLGRSKRPWVARIHTAGFVLCETMVP